MDFNSIMTTLKDLNVWSVSVRVFLAVLLGGFIGLERGHHGRAAGLRTHILVCLGAALATMIGIYSVSELGLSGDPLRVGAQVVSGIGFLGAGTIMVRNKDQITGLTTAAGLWATACIGLAIGIGFYWVAILAFAVVMVSFLFLGQFEIFSKRTSICTCYIEFTTGDNIKDFCSEIEDFAYMISIVPAKSGLSSHVGMEIKTDNPKHYKILQEKAQSRSDVLIALCTKN